MVEESEIMQSLGDVEDPEMKMSVTELGPVSYTHLRAHETLR